MNKSKWKMIKDQLDIKQLLKEIKEIEILHNDWCRENGYPVTSAELQATSFKHQAHRATSSKPQAPSSKHQASSRKRQAP
jgi:hypothetical protein